MTEDLPGQDLVDIAEAIRTRAMSSEECVQASLDRIAALQPRVNAFITTDYEGALAAARRADEALAAGASVGPLHGVPLAHKDLLYRTGRVSTGGTKILQDRVAGVTATALDRLDRAGAVEVGTLNMSEFAAGGTGHNEHFGDCRNPWDLDRIPGGSSSGSGAAVAARMVYGALGSDTGGSVRLPAALCGVAGLKPTDGRVSRFGVMPRSWTTDTLGPLARSVRDLARLLTVIAGHDPADPTTSSAPVPDYEAAIEQPSKPLRVGIPAGPYFEQMDDVVGKTMEEVRSTLAGAGMRVVTVQVPDPQPAFDLGELVVKAEAASLHEPWLRERPHDYSVAVRSVIEGGLYIPAARYLQALRLRGPMLEEFESRVFGQADVLLTPVVPSVAPRLADSDPSTPELAGRSMAEFPRYTRPFSYLGLPALVLTGGFSAAGLPVSFQLVAAPFAETILLRAGHLYQQESDFHRRLPPL